MNLTYKESDYFNLEDYYIIKTNMGYYVSQCHWYNGAWYSNLGLKVKMTSVLSVSFTEILGSEIKYKGTTLKGKVTKVIDSNLGVFWYQGEDYKKYGFPYFWNKVENLEL